MAVPIVIPSEETLILGIDPGTVVMGVSIIACHQKRIRLVHLSTIEMQWQRDLFSRLQQIYNTLNQLIQEYKPSQLAIEAPFFGKNVQSMLKLGRAQGVAITCALQHGLEVYEYSPKKVKQAITGKGNAQKEQVWEMLQLQLAISEKPKGFDASDALAVAVCHFHQRSNPLAGLSGKAANWEEFIKKNPGRVS